MSVKKSLAWMGTAQAASFLGQFAASVILARYLNPHEMGIFAVGLAMVGLLSLVQSFGLQPLIVREPVLDRSIATTAFTVNAVLGVILSLATIACAYLGSAFLGEEGVGRVLIILSLSPLIGILSFLPGARLERDARFKEIALISAASSVSASVATVTLAALGFNYMSLAYGNVFGNVVLAVLFILVGREYFACRLGLADWRRVSSFGTQIFAVVAITTFVQRTSEIMLGRISGLSALGLYNRASGLNNMLWGHVHQLLSRVVLVDFARLHRDGQPLRDRYLQTVSMVTAVLWPAFAAIALLARSIIVLLYGKMWEAAAVPLTCLAIASLILVALTMAWEVFAVTGNVRTQTRIEVVRNLFSMPIFIGACFIGLEAAAASRILDAAIAYLLYRPHLDRLTGTAFSDLAGIYGRSALLALCAIAPSAVALYFAQDGRLSLLPLMLVSGLGGMLWCAALFALKHPLRFELVSIVRKLTPTRLATD